MSIANRKYPRIPLELQATLELQYKTEKKKEWMSIPVSLFSAGPEGVGLKLEAPMEGIVFKQAKCVLHFKANHVAIDIPGRVAWHSDTGDRCDLGIRFDLVLAMASSREVYSSWIVDSIVGLRNAGRREVRRHG